MCSGMYVKSTVELSLTVFRLRLVLKCRALAAVSVVSGTTAEAGIRGAYDWPPTGLSEVRSEEKVVAPDWCMERVCWVAKALRVRAERRETDMAMVRGMGVTMKRGFPEEESRSEVRVPCSEL